jgi:outer membrane protein assembly factor BamE (lipoprotein component of BamABCDE complex)
MTPISSPSLKLNGEPKPNTMPTKQTPLLLTSITLLFILFGLAGCATQQNFAYGTELSADKIAQIKKGVTTRAEVETLFGQPANVSIMGDGKRMMMYGYTSTESEGHADASAYIPVVGLWAGGGQAQVHTRTQSLQIILNAQDVVEDYEFSDNSTNTHSNVSGLAGGLSSSTTSSTNPTGNK